MSKKDVVFKVIFVSQGKIYEIYARHVTQGSLFGFVEIEHLIFGEKSSVLVDPSEEKLKTEFDGVLRSHIPMHAILRIDEVEKEGTGKITTSKTDSNVTPFPIYTPPKSD